VPSIPIVPLAQAPEGVKEPYANLKDAALRRLEFLGQRDVFLAESELTVRALLASRCPVLSVLCTTSMLERLLPTIEERIARDERQLRDKNVAPLTVLTATETEFEGLAGFAFHRGVLAAGLRPPTIEGPALDALLRKSSSLTILEGISNHDNIGSVFRNVAALGGERPAVLLGPGCCDPFYRKSLRVSIGHVLSVPFAGIESLPPARDASGRLMHDAARATPRLWPATLDLVKEHGWRIVALSPRTDAVSLREVAHALGGAKPALLLGAEGPGLTHAAMARADVLCRIPMREGVDSLNIAVAGAVAMSHLLA
jgi:tRNA G18 (ribose-2'-O)-methylase SpoU